MPCNEKLYPLAAIAGQNHLRLALCLLALDPGLGGVLLAGEKGTAKSTAARGMAALLPTLPDGRPAPFVDLPLGATEEMLTGHLDLEAAVGAGQVRLKEGLFARAHGGVIYIDEVNLLPNHLAHLVVEAASSGWAHTQREGLNAWRPARFALVASMNPEEGPLGPQLSDRFGLCVAVDGERDPELRKEILRRHLAFAADPAGFAALWATDQAELRRRVVQGRARLESVALPREVREHAARLAAQAGAQGQRGEIALARAARALAAWEKRDAATIADVRRLAELALGHRRRPTAEPGGQQTARVLAEPAPAGPDQTTIRPDTRQTDPEPEAGHGAGATERALRLIGVGAVRPMVTRLAGRESTSLRQAGRRSARQTTGARGRYLRASAVRLGRPLAMDATLRAAAPHQHERREVGGPALVVRPPDIREKVRASRRGRLLLLGVDASGSMHAARRMQASKEAVLGLLTEAYQKRDRVGMVAFGGTTARVLLSPTPSVEVARRMLAELPSGGKTPLAAGLVAIAGVLEAELAADPKLEPLVLLLTDGRPNVPLAASDTPGWVDGVAGDKGGGWGDRWGDGGYADREVLALARRLSQDRRVRYVVVDTDVGHPAEINLCRPLADYLGGACASLTQMSATGILDLVRTHW